MHNLFRKYYCDWYEWTSSAQFCIKAIFFYKIDTISVIKADIENRNAFQSDDKQTTQTI